MRSIRKDDCGVLVLSHREDIDGIASAALVKLKYGVPDSNIFYSDYTERMLRSVYNGIARLNPISPTLFITDLNANDHLIPVLRDIMTLVRRRGGKVIWIDHHPWSTKCTAALVPLCASVIAGESRMCATELIMRRLKMHGPFLTRLAMLVRCSDFDIRPRSRKDAELVRAYGFGISYYNMLCSESVGDKKIRSLASSIADGKFTNRDLLRSASTFKRISRQRIIAMKGDLHILGDICVGFSKSVTYREACTAMLRATKRSIVIYVNTDNGKTSVVSRGPDITRLAWAFNGGGHPHASGFKLDTEKYRVKSSSGRGLFLRDLAREASRLKIA